MELEVTGILFSKGVERLSLANSFTTYLLPFPIAFKATCPGFSKDRVDFPPSSCYGAVFGIWNEKNVDNTTF